jgi:hypothetical protein
VEETPTSEKAETKGLAGLTRAVMDSPAEEGVLYDLRQLLSLLGTPAYMASREPPERKDTEVEVEVLEDSPLKVTGSPLAVDAFVDGIQSSMVLTWRDSRPVYLAYIAAGAAGPGPDLVGLAERLLLIASVEEQDYLDEINPADQPIPQVLLPATIPPEVERTAGAEVGRVRDLLERTLVERLLAAGARYLVLDGDLMSRTPDVRLVGVVKTSRTRYLPDESVLWTLPAGWRSPIFRIPPHGPSRTDRFSCYLRLNSAANSPWDFGLVRLEAFDRDLLMPLAARVLLERQPEGVSDSRWDRHITSVAVCEQLLRDRRPVIF